MSSPSESGREANEARIEQVLTTAYQREHSSEVHCPMRFDEIIDRAEGDTDEALQIKSETAIRLLLFIFQDGPHPGCTTRLLYLLTQRLKPDLLLNMNGAELAAMFGETRAAWSARVQRIFTGYLKARGVKGYRAAYQKRESSCAKYAAAAMGNTNRRGKTHPLSD